MCNVAPQRAPGARRVQQRKIMLASNLDFWQYTYPDFNKTCKLAGFIVTALGRIDAPHNLTALSRAIAQLTVSELLSAPQEIFD
ncbi:MAG TPA: hypothetical protein V6D12_07720 [Candidatus Obscuribacterales bacterium]